MPGNKTQSKKKYSDKAGRKIKRVMHEWGEGKLYIGKNGKRVKNRKQAIAIGISEARKKGFKTPKRNR
jgi:hypothetical protein